MGGGTFKGLFLTETVTGSHQRSVGPAELLSGLNFQQSSCEMLLQIPWGFCAFESLHHSQAKDVPCQLSSAGQLEEGNRCTASYRTIEHPRLGDDLKKSPSPTLHGEGIPDDII